MKEANHCSLEHDHSLYGCSSTLSDIVRATLQLHTVDSMLEGWRRASGYALSIGKYILRNGDFGYVKQRTEFEDMLRETASDGETEFRYLAELINEHLASGCSRLRVEYIYKETRIWYNRAQALERRATLLLRQSEANETLDSIYVTYFTTLVS